jgi:hypothetical protein
MDPDRGFVGFQLLPNIKYADEILALEWLMDIYKKVDLWRPVLEEAFIRIAPGGARSMESLVEKGYLEKVGAKVLPTDLFVNNAFSIYPRKYAPSVEQQALWEQQKVLALVHSAIELDPENKITHLVLSRLYGAHGVCHDGESLEGKLKSFGHWLDRGYTVVDLARLDRTRPLDEQLPPIVWEYPKQEAA